MNQPRPLNNNTNYLILHQYTYRFFDVVIHGFWHHSYVEIPIQINFAILGMVHPEKQWCN